MSDPVHPSRTREVLRASVPDPRKFARAVALALLTASCSVALLATSMWLITRAADRPPILYLSFAVVGVRAFALGRAFFRYVERLASHDAVFAQLPQLRVRLFARLADLAPWGIAGAGRGDTLSRFVRDVDDLQFYPLRVVLPSIATLGVVAISLVALGLLSPLAALAAGLVLAAATVLAAWLSDRSARLSAREIAPARGQLSDAVLDAVSNVEVNIAFAADQAAAERVRLATAELSRRERALAASSGLGSAVLLLGSAIAIAFAALGLAPQIAGGGLSAPGAAVVLLVPIALADLLAAIPLAMQARHQANGAAARIAALLPEQLPAGIPDERAEALLPRREMSAHPVLRLSAVGARYPGAAAPAIAGVSCELAAGELLVLSGPSGSGKTTIAQLAVRLLDYTGSASLDGIELRELGAQQVREQIVLCEQLPWLFHSTIRGNLQFANPEADELALLAVIERVGLAEWMRERGGLDAEVGERGELVSGGQAQRIALARALLSTAPIIICDEPTANVDPQRAEALLRDIASLTPERSVLLITHEQLPADLPARTLRMPFTALR